MLGLNDDAELEGVRERFPWMSFVKTRKVVKAYYTSKTGMRRRKTIRAKSWKHSALKEAGERLACYVKKPHHALDCNGRFVGAWKNCLDIFATDTGPGDGEDDDKESPSNRGSESGNEDESVEES